MSTKKSRKSRKRKQPSANGKQSKINTEHAPPRKKARISKNLNKSYPCLDDTKNENENEKEDNYYSGPECPEPYVPPNTPNNSTPISPRSPRRYIDSQSMGLGLSDTIDEEYEGEQEQAVDDNDSFDVDENDHDFDTMHYHSNPIPINNNNHVDNMNNNNRNMDNNDNGRIPYNSFNYITDRNHSQNNINNQNNDRRDTPSLHTSQDSISPDPASPKSRPSSRRNQTLGDGEDDHNNNHNNRGRDNQVRLLINNATRNGRYPPSATQQRTTSANNSTRDRRQRETERRDRKPRNSDISRIQQVFDKKGWLLYIVCGFMIGCLIMYGSLAFMDIMGLQWKCADIKSNGSFPLEFPKNVSCAECMAKYNEQQEAYQQCITRNNKYKTDERALDAEINRLQSEIDELQERIDQHQSIADALDQCNNNKQTLLNDLKQCQDKNEELKKKNCGEYINRIDELEHDLGECNVEWGFCQQEGRQKDALDKKRIEEINDQRNKFDLCNKQLKEYKQKAKANKK